MVNLWNPAFFLPTVSYGFIIYKPVLFNIISFWSNLCRTWWRKIQFMQSKDFSASKLIICFGCDSNFVTHCCSDKEKRHTDSSHSHACPAPLPASSNHTSASALCTFNASHRIRNYRIFNTSKRNSYLNTGADPLGAVSNNSPKNLFTWSIREYSKLWKSTPGFPGYLQLFTGAQTWS